jgi:hypothetical protein
MSENIKRKNDTGVNININNSDKNSSSAEGGSLTDKIIDAGLKLIIPVGLLLALILFVVFISVVLPLITWILDIVGAISGVGDGDGEIFSPLNLATGGFGSIFAALFGGGD